jgi:hypothetical protein
MSGKVKIYFISRLGADRQAFRNLIFPTDLELIYLDWIIPMPDELLGGLYKCLIMSNIQLRYIYVPEKFFRKDCRYVIYRFHLYKEMNSI